MKNRKIITILSCSVIIIMFSICVINTNNNMSNQTVLTSSIQGLSNKKIGWGIKRNDNHNQPDLGSKNKQLLNEANGIAMGNNNDKYVYLTFDEGYEAGYTSKILDTLKDNNVKVAFFITAHYLNTNSDLVKRMIDEGHIVGNHIPLTLMTLF